PTKETKSLQGLDRLIEAAGDGDVGAGLAQRRQCLKLLVADASALGLQLEAENAAVVDRDDVRHAGDDAETLHDRGLDRLAIAAVCWMECEYTWRAADTEMDEHGALNGLLCARGGHVCLHRHAEMSPGLLPSRAPFSSSANSCLRCSAAC